MLMSYIYRPDRSVSALCVPVLRQLPYNNVTSAYYLDAKFALYKFHNNIKNRNVQNVNKKTNKKPSHFELIKGRQRNPKALPQGLLDSMKSTAFYFAQNAILIY